MEAPLSGHHHLASTGDEIWRRPFRWCSQWPCKYMAEKTVLQVEAAHAEHCTVNHQGWMRPRYRLLGHNPSFQKRTQVLYQVKHSWPPPPPRCSGALLYPRGTPNCEHRPSERVQSNTSVLPLPRAEFRLKEPPLFYGYASPVSSHPSYYLYQISHYISPRGKL